MEALHGIDLTVPANGITVLAGPNGAGKTTLLNTIAGLLRPTSGALLSADDDGTPIDLAAMAVADRVQAGVTLIPDGAGVFGSLTVAENLDLFARQAGQDGRAGQDARAGQDVGHGPALDLFPELATFLDRRAGTLSGGEQQMLALSRAVLTPWRLLLVDELSHGLAPRIAARCYAALAEIASPGKVSRAVVLAEPHAQRQDGLPLLSAADHIVSLHRGEVLQTSDRALTAQGE
ncbi:MAG TPA: ATP-binding cassette domain-containing protein [Actinocrinis sp.]|nr:ATP-binding cassette domain-containing protein [Actinocrinis sp.]